MRAMMEHPLCKAMIANDVVDLADRHGLWWMVDYIALYVTGPNACALEDTVWTLRAESKEPDGLVYVWSLACETLADPPKVLHDMYWNPSKMPLSSTIRFPADVSRVTVRVVKWPADASGCVLPTLCRGEANA